MPRAAQVGGCFIGHADDPQVVGQVVARDRFTRLIGESDDRDQDVLLLRQFELLERAEHAPFDDGFECLGTNDCIMR